MIWLFFWWAGSTGPVITPVTDVTADFLVLVPADDVVVQIR